MKDLGRVSNFIEVGTLLFGEKVKTHYKIEKDYDSSDDTVITFYLTRVVDEIVYTASKSFILHETFTGVLLETEDDDLYFLKYNFKRSVPTEDKDCISFNS